MMRVAHVIWTANFGGIEKLVYDLVRAQALDPELRPAVIFGRAEGGLLDNFRATGLPCFDLGFRGGFDLHPGRVLNARRLFQEFDVLHLHTFVSGLGLAAATSRPPIVYTEHGNFGFGRRPTWQDSVKRPIFHSFIKNRVSYLTFNSAFTRSVWAQRSCPMPLENGVVRNGIDFITTDPAQIVPAPELTRWTKSSFVVGTSSRFASVKRIDRLIEGFARFHGGRDAKLMLVGDGPLRSEFESSVQALGLADRTLFTGFRSDVRACQAVMDVCVHPSAGESFGLVCVETLALGKPTIVFRDGGGMTDIVQSLFPDDVMDTVDALSDRLAYYCSNPVARVAATEQRIAHARLFDIRSTSAAFGQIYRQVSQRS
jgi:L-malate glycosyltransferase